MKLTVENSIDIVNRFKSNLSQPISSSLTRIPSISLLKSSKHHQTNGNHYKAFKHHRQTYLHQHRLTNTRSMLCLDHSNIIKRVSIHSHYQKYQCQQLQSCKETIHRSGTGMWLRGNYFTRCNASHCTTRNVLFSVTFSRQPALCRSTKVTVSVLTLTRKLESLNKLWNPPPSISPTNFREEKFNLILVISLRSS